MDRKDELENGVKAYGQETADQTAHEVGRTIRALRKGKKMTLEQLAHRAETDAGSLSRIERGKQGWTNETISAIANGLGVPVRSLFDGLPNWMAVENEDSGYIVVPHWRSLDATDPGAPAGVPFPKAWLPQGIQLARLVWLSAPAFWAGFVLVDADCKDLLDKQYDGRLFAFEHHNNDARVRRVFWRYDGYLRLVPDSSSSEQVEDVVPLADVSHLPCIGRVIWGGTPL